MKINNITFKQFIYTYNFRTNIKCSNPECLNTDIVRIYLQFKDISDIDNWIEIGIYDWDNKNNVWDRLCNILNKDIIYSYITEMKYDTDIDTFCIYLTNEKLYIG